jgi:hypothetical protein
MFAMATVVGWFVVSQLAIWFGMVGIVIAVPVLVGVAALVWSRTRLGIGWMLGTAFGALPVAAFYVLWWL